MNSSRIGWPRVTLRACDLELRVRTPWGQGGESLEFGVHSPSGAVPYFNETVQGPRIRNPEQYQRRIFSKLGRLCEGLDVDGQGQSKAQVAQDLVALGQDLYEDVLGREMKRLFRDLGPKIRTLLVVSDEPWIPWEILHGLEDGDDFFCMRFQMGRWLSGETPLLGEKRVSRMLVVGGEAPGALPGSDRELKMLRTWLSGLKGVDDRVLAAATSRSVLKELGAQVHDVFHFAGHGLHDEEQGSESKLGLEDRPFRAHHLSASWAPRFRSIRPLVFFNACQTGRLEHSLSGLDGWAARWVQRFGCGAFLAPLWSVKDSAAQIFAQVFYEELARGLTLGEAVVNARRQVRRRDPASLDWAAYSVYGHPNLRVVFGHAPAVSDEVGTKAPPSRPAPPSPNPRFDASPAGGQQSDPLQSDPLRRAGHRPAPAPPRPIPEPTGHTNGTNGRRRPAAWLAGVLVGLVALWFGSTDPLPWESTEPVTQPPVVGGEETETSEKESGDLESQPGGPSISKKEDSPEPDSPTVKTDPGIQTPPPEDPKKRVYQPPPPTQPKAQGVPLRSIVDGRLKVVVVRQGSDTRVDDLATLLESLLLQNAPSMSALGFSAQDMATVRRVVNDPSMLDGNLAPWGAERLLLVESSRRPLDRPSSSPGIALSVTVRLLNLRTGSTEFLEAPTKKGVGRSQEEALLQASERCFSNLFLKLGGGNDEDSFSST